MTTRISVRNITFTAIGIALYVALSMTLKIPLVGHIALDLGYIIFAIYCYQFGPVSGAVVGAAGCTLVSLITSGFFPAGWILGNALIGCICGTFFDRCEQPFSPIWNVLCSIFAVALGVLVVKTAVECALFSIPVLVKAPKNLVAAVADAAVMCAGVLIAPIFSQRSGTLYRWREK